MTIQRTITFEATCDTDEEYDELHAQLATQAPEVAIIAQDTQARRITAQRQDTVEIQ